MANGFAIEYGFCYQYINDFMENYETSTMVK